MRAREFLIGLMVTTLAGACSCQQSTEYSTGGSDRISFGHLGEEQRPFEKGSVFEDSVHLELVGPYR